MKKQKPSLFGEHKNLFIAAGVAAIAGVGIYVYSINSEPDLGLVTTSTSKESVRPANNNNGNKNSGKPAAGDLSELRGKNVLNVGPQNAGKEMIVDLVNLAKPGYVAVYSANSKGQPGSLVAVSPLLKAGTSQDLVVKASLHANTTYVVELRNDDGDGKFNAAKDMILMDQAGKEVTANITTSK